MKAWLERTEVLEPLVSTFEAFFDLSPGRDIHMHGEGYIPAREIEAYCQLVGMDEPEERLGFFRLIRAMDRAFLDHREKARQDAEKRSEAEKSRKPAK